MSLETFKSFVKKRPSLQTYVQKGEMTWQGFYDLYELYGENNSIWDKYLKVNINKSAPVTLKDMFEMIKNIDMTEMQNTVNSFQKAVGYLEELAKTKEDKTQVKKSSYEARPLYRYFDD